jgi:hypothetical protein
MERKTINALEVILMLGVSILILLISYRCESTAKSSVPDADTITYDILPTVPTFMDKSAKEGLWEALLYYEIKHPEIVYAQAILETGHFKSKGCTRDNNLFGLFNSREMKYHKFSHWSQSVEAYKNWIQNRYKDSEDYYTFLERIGYAEDPNYINKLKQIVKNGKIK